MNERRHGGWVWAAAIGATAIICATATAGQIRIWPTATVTGEAVQLQQLAELRGFEEEQLQRLAQVKVFSAPSAGGEILVRADDIRTALAEAGEDLSTISMLGAARCRVSKPLPPRPPRKSFAAPAPKEKREAPRLVRSQPVTMAEQPAPSASPGSLETALREYIIAGFPQHDAKLEIRFSPAKAEDLRISEPGTKFDIRSRDDAKLGLRGFEVVVHRGGEDDRTIPIVAEVTLIEEVVVAKRAINRGETIEGRALKLEDRRFTDLAAVGLTDLSTAIDQQCRGFLRPGEMLTAGSVEQRPVVVRGQPVTIWMRQGSLAIRTTGKAQQSGALGDRIEVLRDGAKRKQDLIEAIVSGPGTVSMGDPADQLALQ